MDNYDHLPVEIEVAVSATSLTLREFLDLKPGMVIPCVRRADGLLPITAGGQLLGYGRLEEAGGLGVRLVQLAENLQ